MRGGIVTGIALALLALLIRCGGGDGGGSPSGIDKLLQDTACNEEKGALSSP